MPPSLGPRRGRKLPMMVCRWPFESPRRGSKGVSHPGISAGRWSGASLLKLGVEGVGASAPAACGMDGADGWEPDVAASSVIGDLQIKCYHACCERLPRADVAADHNLRRGFCVSPSRICTLEHYTSRARAIFSRMRTGAESGATMAAGSTRNVCSSAYWPASTAWGTVSV